MIGGDLQSLKKRLIANSITEVVHIRGVSLVVSDLPYEEEEIDTLMWNPLHYAVYHGQLEIV